MSEVIFKDYVELSSIFPDLTHISDADQFKADNESLTFKIKDEFVDIPWDPSTTNVVMVVGVNQQTLKRYITTYVSGGTTEYGSDWDEGYYKIYVRKYKRPTNGSDYVSLLDSNDFYELTKKELFWNKSILSFMVYIQPGKFWMGSPDNEIGHLPGEYYHNVTLTEGFYIGRTVLTNGMFDAVMNGIKPASDVTTIEIGGETQNTCFSLSNTYWAWYKETDKNDEFGKVYISYNKYERDKSTRDGEVNGFKKTTLNGQTTYYPYPYLFNNNLPSGETDNSFITVINSKLPITGSSTNDYTGSYTWDLPTEAQWEYACRSGKKSAFNNGENLKVKDFKETETSYATEPQINEICWYKMHDGQRHECAMLKPSAWGLYDMHGNNWEWTKDFNNDYSLEKFVVDPYASVPQYIGEDVYTSKSIRGGWAGWSSRACRAAYRYEDRVSAVAPSFGARLILRKGVIDITISPKDVEVCGDEQVTTGMCTCSLSRELANENDVVSVTYSVDNTNKKISITSASITYTGSEVYSYNVTIGPDAKIIRNEPINYSPKITPEFIGISQDVSVQNPPVQSDFTYHIENIAPDDFITFITSSINLDSDHYNVQVSNYVLNTSSFGCKLYTGSVLPIIQVPIETPTINIVVTPINIDGICGTSTQVTTSSCSYEITEGFIVDSENDTISVDYYIYNDNSETGSYYYISNVSIEKGGSGNYRYNITTEGTASIIKIKRETFPVTITPSIRLNNPEWPLNPADSPSSIAEKLTITPVASNLIDGDYVDPNSYECTITNNGTQITFTTEHYSIIKQDIYNGGCYSYSPVALGQYVYTFPQDNVYDVKFTPILDAVCEDYTVTTSDISYRSEGLIVSGDTVNISYSVDNTNNKISISSVSITKSNPSDNSYSYNITTETGSIVRKAKEQYYIDIDPYYNSNDIILTSDSVDTVISKLNYRLNVNPQPGDSISDVTYNGTKDSGTNVMNFGIDDYTISYAAGSCRTYAVASGYLIVYPVTVSGSLSMCPGSTTQDIINNLGNTSPYISGLMNGDEISNVTYTYDTTTEKIVPDISNISIDKKGTGNYWYSFNLVSKDVNVGDKQEIYVKISPNCNLNGNVLYSTDSDATILSKITYGCIVDSTNIKSGDTVTVENSDQQSTYIITINKNNNTVTVTLNPNLVINQTIDPNNATDCYEYVKEVDPNSQVFTITQVIDVTITAKELLNIDCTNKESLYDYSITSGTVNSNDTIGTPTYSYNSSNNTYIVTNLPITVVTGANRIYNITYVAASLTCRSSQQTKTITLSGTMNDICIIPGTTSEEKIQAMENATSSRHVQYTIDGNTEDVGAGKIVTNVTYNNPQEN